MKYLLLLFLTTSCVTTQEPLTNKQFKSYVKSQRRKLRILHERIRDLENEVYLKKYTPRD